MLSRNATDFWWIHQTDLIIGADFFVAPGNEGVAFTPAEGNLASVDSMPTQTQRYFSIDVLTDDLVEIDIIPKLNATVFPGGTPLITLVCPAVLQHNTTYNLAPPFNQNGCLVITSDYLVLRVRNVSGNVVSPFHLQARVWR